MNDETTKQKNYLTFYDQVYSQDNPKGDSFAWVQWKGTDVCIDLYCKCGVHEHYDGKCLHYYECWSCGAKYAIGLNIKLIPLTENQSKYVAKNLGGFMVCENEEGTWKLNRDIK